MNTTTARTAPRRCRRCTIWRIESEKRERDERDGCFVCERERKRESTER